VSASQQARPVIRGEAAQRVRRRHARSAAACDGRRPILSPPMTTRILDKSKQNRKRVISIIAIGVANGWATQCFGSRNDGRRSRAANMRNRVANTAQRTARHVRRSVRKTVGRRAGRRSQPAPGTIGGADCSHRKYSFP
jgi:hypothetical protein